jgi:hypothetical protein
MTQIRRWRHQEQPTSIIEERLSCSFYRMSVWLFFRLFLLAIIAAVAFLATNFEAFRFMNQFHLFRKVRNYAAFFFMFIGRLAAGVFAAITGQEQKPRIEQIHHATVLVIEILTLCLLVSTFSTLYDNAVNQFARKNLREVMRRIQVIAGVLDGGGRPTIADARKRCEELRGFASCASCGSIHDAVSHLRLLHYPQPQFPSAEAATRAAADEKYADDLKFSHQQASALIPTLKKLDTEIQAAILSLNRLPNRFSTFSRHPGKQVHADAVIEADGVARQLNQVSLQLNLFLTALAVLKEESLERRQAAATESETSVRAAAHSAAEYEELVRRPTNMAQPSSRRHIRAYVVTVCLLVSAAYILWKHSQATTLVRISYSPSTEIALLENYFQTSEFANSFQALVLQILGSQSSFHPSHFLLESVSAASETRTDSSS